MADRKLTMAQIEEIRSLKAEMEAEGKPFYYSHIAKMYGVSGPTIRRNISPSEYDKKPRKSFKYDPEIAKAQRETYRSYQLRVSKKHETESLIIQKLDSVENKQKYIKDLILRDIHLENN